jgi:hypothetical protein
MAKASMVLRNTHGTGHDRPIAVVAARVSVQKKIQELHAKEVGVGNPSEERASS